VAADGIVTLAERLWPALQDIDTSSGALGSTVNRVLDELLPILIAAPADVRSRGQWLERLFEAVQNDGVEYLTPIEDRWGEIAVYPELMNVYADQLRPLIRRVWVEEKPGGHVRGTAICLSCLLEVGRYGDLLELLATAPRRWWWHRFGAEALARQGLHEAAMTYAEACRDRTLAPYDERRIDRFCERVLINAGHSDQAYQRFGLRAANGPTFLAIYRATVRSYPDRHKRQILLDLIAVRNQPGKWFAAAKSTGFLDVALECAASHDAEPATLVRAARDYRAREPRFAIQVALLALRHLLAGGGYEPNVSLVPEAADYLLDAAKRIGAEPWAREQAEQLAEEPCPPGQEPMQRALMTRLAPDGEAPAAVLHQETKRR
jgi:hypothetical protein